MVFLKREASGPTLVAVLQTDVPVALEDLLLQAGGFSAIVLDMGTLANWEGRRRPATSCYSRLARRMIWCPYTDSVGRFWA